MFKTKQKQKQLEKLPSLISHLSVNFLAGLAAPGPESEGAEDTFLCLLPQGWVGFGAKFCAVGEEERWEAAPASHYSDHWECHLETDADSPNSEAEGGSSTGSHLVEDLNRTDPKCASDSPQMVDLSLSSMDGLLYLHFHKYRSGKMKRPLRLFIWIHHLIKVNPPTVDFQTLPKLKH